MEKLLGIVSFNGGERETSLSETEKLFYLRSSIKNKEGQDILTAAAGTVGDYEQVVKMLKNQYDCPRPIYRMNLLRIHNKHIAYTKEDFLETLDLWNKQLMGIRQYGPFELSTALTAVAESNKDEQMFREWSIFTAKKEVVPRHELFLKFLKARGRALPPSVKLNARSATTDKKPWTAAKNLSRFTTFHVNYITGCSVCEDKSHTIYRCSAFYELTVEQRQSTVHHLKLCHNCLGTGHISRDCLSQKSCKVCGKQHHTMLHRKDHRLTTTNSQENPNPADFNVTAPGAVCCS